MTLQKVLWLEIKSRINKQSFWAMTNLRDRKSRPWTTSCAPRDNPVQSSASPCRGARRKYSDAWYCSTDRWSGRTVQSYKCHCKENFLEITDNELWFLFVYLIMGSVSSLPSIVVYGTPRTRSIMCTNPLVWATSACSTVALTPPPSTVTTASAPSPLTLKYRKVRLFIVGTWAIYLI